jgi:hypothetical protein
MFTRKHYQFIADNFNTLLDNATDDHEAFVIDEAARFFADKLKQNNSRFNKDRFLSACGLTEINS